MGSSPTKISFGGRSDKSFVKMISDFSLVNSPVNSGTKTSGFSKLLNF